MTGRGQIGSVRARGEREGSERAHLDLFSGPGVQGEALDLADVGAEFSVHGSALDAEKDAVVPCCPAGVPSAAVCALVVSGFLDEGEDLPLVALCGGFGRHGSWLWNLGCERPSRASSAGSGGRRSERRRTEGAGVQAGRDRILGRL